MDKNLRFVIILTVLMTVCAILSSYIFATMFVFLFNMSVWFAIASSTLIGIMGGCQLMKGITDRVLTEVKNEKL